MASGKQKIPKTTTLSVRLPIEHKEAIEKAAVEAKTTMSGYAARVLVEAATGRTAAKSEAQKPDKLEVPPPTVAKGIVVSDPHALEQLRRIGININQIAHASNAGRDYSSRDLARSVSTVFALLQDPEAFMRHVEKMPRIAPPSVTTRATPQTNVPSASAVQATAQPPKPAIAPQAPKPSVEPPLPERRSIPAHVYGEIAAALSQKTQPVAPPATIPPRAPPPAAPDAVTPRRRRHLPSTSSIQRAAAASKQVPTPQLAAPIKAPAAQPVMKDQRRDPPHPQARHQLQDRAPVRPQRPGPAEDSKPGRLGFLSKLWGR